MGKFDGILICTDLDGTLYKNDKTISEKNREAIAHFKREGGSFTFITGRMPYYSRDAFNAANPNVPYGCINGGGLYDGAENKYIWTKEISRSVIELIEHIDECFSDVGIQICCFDRTLFARENNTTVRFRHLTGLPNIVCDYRSVTEPIAKVIFCTDDEDKLLSIERALYEHRLSSEFDFIRSERTLFEILPRGVDKGLALRKLSEHLGIEMARTVAIGDYDNDAPMLRVAGCGVAVSNASRAALDAADIVTVSNEEDAVASVIYNIEDGKYGF